MTLGSGGDSRAEASLCWHGMRDNLAGTTRYVWPEPIQLQCSELFIQTEFTVGTLVSEKVYQTQVLKENIPNDWENKEVFLERKGHLLRFGKAVGSVPLRHACCHVGISV